MRRACAEIPSKSALQILHSCHSSLSHRRNNSPITAYPSAARISISLLSFPFRRPNRIVLLFNKYVCSCVCVCVRMIIFYYRLPSPKVRSPTPRICFVQHSGKVLLLLLLIYGSFGHLVNYIVMKIVDFGHPPNSQATPQNPKAK